MKKYGSFSKRLLAFLIDTVIFAVMGAFFDDNTVMQLFILITWTAYIVWMNGMYGATIGKMVMKLKITKENGSKISYSDALIRELASYLSFAALFIGYLNVVWDKKKQSWHDKIAKTIVINN